MNSQLVRGAAITGKKFQDHGKAFNEGLMKGRDPNALANAELQAKQQRRASDEYIAAVAKMNSVKNSFKNLKNQFDMFGANKKEVAESMLEGLYSKGNDTNEMSLLTSVYTDELDIEIGEDGNIGFMTEEGITNFGDLPDYFNKDYASGDAIMKMSNQIYKAGIPLNSATKMMYENSLYNMIEKGGVATLKSLARDDFFNRGGIPNITDEELNDPMQRDAVEKKIVDHFMGVMNTQAQNGAAAKKNSTGGSKTGGTDSFRKDKAKYDLYKEYTDRGDVPPLPSNYQVRPETVKDKDGNYVDPVDIGKEPTGKMEVIGPGGGSHIIDLSTPEGKKAFYIFIGIRPDVFGADDFTVDPLDPNN